MEYETPNFDKENRRQKILAELAELDQKGIPSEGPEHNMGNEIVERKAALQKELEEIDPIQ